jgi:integrase
MAAKVHLTQRLCDELTFDQTVVSVSATGRPKFQRTASDVHDWVLLDAGMPGLFLRFTRGTTTWYVQKKMGGRRTKRAMGHLHAEGSQGTLTLAQARNIARIWLSDMTQGIDPLAMKKERTAANQIARERERLTMRVAYDDYVSAATAKSKGTTTTDRGKVAKWMARSPLWSVPVVDLAPAHVAGSLGPLLALVKDPRSPKPGWGPKSISPGTLHKIYAYSAAAWTSAARHLKMGGTGRGESPFAMWKDSQDWPAAVERDTFLDTDTDTGKAWIKGLVALHEKSHDPALFAVRPDPRSQGMKPHTSVLVDMVLLVLLWGTRKTETAVLQWSDVDFRRGLVWLRPDTTKNGTLDTVPLTEWAAQILRERQALNALWRPDDASPYVFPSRKRGQPLGTARGILVALEEETGLTIRSHDLRRTMATELDTKDSIEKAAKLVLAGAALHHTPGRGGISSATQRYLVKKVEVLRPLFQEREDRLRALAGLPVRSGAAPLDGLKTEDLFEQATKDPDFKRKYLEWIATA